MASPTTRELSHVPPPACLCSRRRLPCRKGGILCPYLPPVGLSLSCGALFPKQCSSSACRPCVARPGLAGCVCCCVLCAVRCVLCILWARLRLAVCPIAERTVPNNATGAQLRELCSESSPMSCCLPPVSLLPSSQVSPPQRHRRRSVAARCCFLVHPTHGGSAPHALQPY